MAQITAVDYIISKLRQLAFNENTHLGMGDVRVTQGLIDELEYQAKQMEKEQIEIAHMAASVNSSMVEAEYLAEQYYNETYGN